MALRVERDNVKIGLLDIIANEPFYGFTYDSAYLSTPKATPVSLSLPLTESRYSGDKAQPFFEGLLPEGDARDLIARRLGIPRTSSAKLLKALGRDCAGDLTIIDEEERPAHTLEHSPDDNSGKYTPLVGGLRRIAESPLEEIPRLQEGARLSLAGAQSKISLYHTRGEAIDCGWYVPSPGAPSTHIIKPGVLENTYPYITLNEFLCLRAAASCGIRSVDADILYPESPVLVTQRYDRSMSAAPNNGFAIVERLHQEDCCQACGVKSHMKYEHDGGPGYAMIRDLLAKHARNPLEDTTTLVKWALLNFLVGNCDAHAKNISLLHNMDGTVSLAPVYDLISTVVYDGSFGSKLSRNAGMRFGMHENIDRINSEDVRAFARDVHMRLQQVKIIGDELIQSLPSAFREAGAAAENAGFKAAEDMTGRILRGCEKRAKVLV